MPRLLPWLLVCLSACAIELERARQLYDRTDYRESLRILEAAPAKDRTAEVEALIGINYMMLGDFKKAIDHLEKAVQREPRSSQFHLWLGQAWGRRAEKANVFAAPRYASRCRQAFERAVELDPKNRRAVHDLFLYYLEAPGIMGGGVDEAERLAARLEPLDPPEHQLALAKVAEKRKQYEKAEGHLRRAVDLSSGDVGRVVELARFLARRGRVEESEALFDRAARSGPESPWLLFGRASVYVESKRNLGMARDLLKRYLAVPLSPDHPPRQEAERLLREAGG
jgi:tetratricopeptide (TPR) repeat protein